MSTLVAIGIEVAYTFVLLYRVVNGTVRMEVDG